MWIRKETQKAIVPNLRESDSRVSTDSENWIAVADLAVPVVVCSSTGKVRSFSDHAEGLMNSLGVTLTRGSPLPASLWATLTQVPLGEATEWRPEGSRGDAVVGCTPYRLGSDRRIILMRELSTKNAQLLQRLHRQRLEFAGRMVASIAHDLRTPLSSIVYNTSFLRIRQGDVAPTEAKEALSEIGEAADRLQRAVDVLLDFARLGPQVQAEVAMRLVIDRAVTLLHPVYRKHGHQLSVTCGEDERVTGNPIVVEQILANLLLNAAEASEAPLCISVSVCRSDEHPGFVRTTVEDDGPGVPADRAKWIFEPFYTTKQEGTGLGLTMAKEAAEKLDGHLFLEPSRAGARFVLLLPRCAPERSAE